MEIDIGDKPIAELHAHLDNGHWSVVKANVKSDTPVHTHTHDP